jgi:indole-3-glycerol phosphate synthase
VVHFGLSRAILSTNNKAIPAIIAEIKTFSPRYGDLLAGRSILDILHIYEDCEATGISYITAAQFKGTITELRTICNESSLPVLRKDFITTAEAIEETATAGASAILLIARLLKDRTAELVDVARSCGLDTLLEVHSEEDIAIAETTKTTIIGINNRDIACFETDDGTVSVTEELAPRISKGAILVSESGIATRSDLARALAHADAALIGTALMSATSISAKMQELMGAGI